VQAGFVNATFVFNARVEQCTGVDWHKADKTRNGPNILDAKEVEQDFPYIAVSNLYYSQDCVDKLALLASYSLTASSEYRAFAACFGADSDSIESVASAAATSEVDDTNDADM
jgi:hypothetical protein